MTQPKFVPTLPEDQVRDAYQLEQPRPWQADRPADFTPGRFVTGHGRGVQGPDQGYAFRLARRFEEKLTLTEGESFEDISAAGVAIALRRAALFGRAPVTADLELAFSLLGCLRPGAPGASGAGGAADAGDAGSGSGGSAAPADLVAWRAARSRGLSHHPVEARELAEAVPESTLRLRPDDVRGRVSSWRSLAGAGAGDSVAEGATPAGASDPADGGTSAPDAWVPSGAS
jgi:hypothetical protein